MLPINIHDLLHQRTIEGERVEYKAGWSPESVLHTMCAFANDFNNLGGGYLVMGVEERDGRPVLPPKGLAPEAVDAILKELLNLGNAAIQPQYHPITAVYQVQKRTVLALWAPGGETRPYKARKSLSRKSTDWAYFIRKHSCTVRAKGADERELLSLAATVPYDDRFNQTAVLDDLSPWLIEQYLKDVGSELAADARDMGREELGRRMNIVGGPSEAPFPKNVGLLFFNDEPGRFFPATQIDVVWFPEGPGGDRFEEKIFQGPLGRITRDAVDYINRMFLREVVIKHPGRAEAQRFWNFPHAAIEEAVVNAVYHRSYEIREPIEVRISPDELTVLSFPGPDRSIRMNDLRTGQAISRRYRNRRIGEFLKELELTEGRSTGIPKVLRAMRSNGSPEPIFDTDAERTYFLIRLPVHPLARPEPVAREAPREVGYLEAHHVSEQPARQWGAPEKGVRSASTEEALLHFLHNAPLSKTELAAALGRKSITGALNRVVRSLLKDGLIEYTLPHKPNSRMQKYRLTPQGAARLFHARRDRP